LSKAMRRLMKPRTLLLATLILAVSAATAAAATITGPPSGNWTLIGTPGSDSISGANGNYTIIGLGGNDAINVGSGNNFIEADGSCPKGDQDSITPSPGNAVYCEADQITTSHSTTVNAGNGNNIVLGNGYGNNTINVGNGANAVYGGGSHSNTINAGNGPNLIVGGSGSNTINVGNANVNCGGSGQAPCADVVYAGGGPDTINVGSGTSLILAQNKQVDHITCAKGNNATVYADKNDVVKGCKTVITSPAPSALAAPPAVGTPAKAAVTHSKSASSKARKHARKAAKHSSKRH
jgi:Ca2+-binding RTX toxin-like protein